MGICPLNVCVTDYIDSNIFSVLKTIIVCLLYITTTNTGIKAKTDSQRI